MITKITLPPATPPQLIISTDTTDDLWPCVARYRLAVWKLDAISVRRSARRQIN